jgi:dTDP-4-dehydrorhamnose reductase
MRMREILVTGATGQVGGFIAGECRDDVAFVALPRSDCDLADRDSITRAVSLRPWAGVINAAAYTAVDLAESEPEAAWCVNAQAMQWLAEATARIGIPLVHVSTDYVFSGDLDRPYEEDDPHCPLGVYGASKAAGEQRIRAAHPRHAILRTSWVMSERGQNFAKTMLRLARERTTLDIVADQHGAPTHARDLAQALMKVAARLASDPDAATGTFHYTGDGAATWADVAEEIFRVSRACGGPFATVNRVDSAAFARPAPRPKNSRLAAGRLVSAFGVTRRPWRECVSDIVQQIMASERSVPS